jgi:flagellar protein FlgJ
LLDSAQGDLGQDLLDQQFATQMSGRPGGLSDLIAQQLTRQSSAAPTSSATSLPSPAVSSAPKASTSASASRTPANVKQAGFVQQHDAVAKRVAQDSGIPAGYMIGQAGHETGWGQREIKMKDGTPSFNLFAMKAGANWKG